MTKTSKLPTDEKNITVLEVVIILAHLSQRLIGELIVYQWSGVRPSSGRCPSIRRPQCLNIFFSETAWPIIAKFYLEPPWVRGTKVCSQDLGHKK